MIERQSQRSASPTSAALNHSGEERIMMDAKAAQAKISAAILADAENVIARAIALHPATAEIVADVRLAPGSIQGVAAIALKSALRGADNAATLANMIQFAESL